MQHGAGGCGFFFSFDYSVMIR